MRTISLRNGAVLLALILICTAVPVARSAEDFDWPQWQGPDRNGQSREKGLQQNWAKNGPKLLWKIGGMGEGFSTPTVAAGRIFLMGNLGETEFLIAVAEKDGSPLWSSPVGTVRATGGGYPGPRCSPTVDGDRVYALGLNGDLLCADVKTGKELWKKELTKKPLAGRVGGWGYSESPLVDGDRVLVTPGGPDATIVALNRNNGELIWKGATPQKDQAHYSSIIQAKIRGEKQYIQFLSGGVAGFSAEGKFLWRYDHPHNGTANCSTAICQDDQIFAASNYGTGGGLATIVKSAGENHYNAEEVYFTRDMQNHHGGMVLIDGYLYGENGGKLTCLEFKTGKKAWSEGKAGKGSIFYADGRLYYRNEGGPILLVEASPSAYKELGRFDQPHRSKREAWPHPIVANGKLYIRDQDNLLCYDVRQP